MIIFPQEPQSKRGDPGLLWRVWRRECGSTLESLKSQCGGRNVVLPWELWVLEGSQVIRKGPNRANPSQSTVSHGGLPEETVDEFGDRVGAGLRMTFWADLDTRYSQGWPSPLPTTACCFHLPTHHLHLPSWTPRTYLRIPTFRDHCPQTANPWGLGGQCLWRRKPSLATSLDRSLQIHLTIPSLSHTQAFARCSL